MCCSSCGFENPQGMKFCGECGAVLNNHCVSCGFQNPPRFKFCGQCGAFLAEQTPTAKPAQSRKRAGKRAEEGRQTGPTLAWNGAPQGERRQLTVMFCDLVGSTSLSERLDPEELREVLREYQGVCGGVIRRLEGYLAQYMGDGLLVYFGYPRAHEDDAQRAVQAGLEMVEETQKLNARLQRTAEVLHTIPLQVRIGIHTGLVVVGEMGEGGFRDPMAIVGDTPNIAARLQEIAEPNTVVISLANYRLIQGFFQSRDLGSHLFKGMSTAVPVYRVLGGSGVQSRFEVAVKTGLTPLVDREEEMKLLLKRWDQVKDGEGQVVLVRGEAGIGKSRLVQELEEQVTAEGYVKIRSRCSSYYQNSAFYPVIEHLQRLLRFGRENSPPEKLGKLEQALESYGFSLQEVVPLLAPLLSLPLSDCYPPLSLTPQRQKQKILEVMVAWLLKETEKLPVLLIVEDLQWVDPSTLELFSLLIDQAPTARILSLLTFRPEFSPTWGTRSHLTYLTLNRLAHKQAEEMVEKVMENKTLPMEVMQQVVTKTDGVPLFVEELTKMVVESGLLCEAGDHYELTGLLPPLAIPATLQDSLIARLDRLALGREVAQLGAALGREFPYELLQAVSPLDEGTLQRELARLVEAEILYQKGLLPQARYVFKHALIQDAAYQSLLKSKRQQVHQKIVQVLEERFAETTETRLELLAHHCTEAGLIGQAIPYWQRAGQQATQRSANVEAISHLSKGLELLKALPDTPERIQQELPLQIALGTPLMATKGYAAPEVEKAYTRARELCQQMGETPQFFSALLGLTIFYLVRTEFKTAHELGEQLLKLAQSAQDTGLLLQAHYTLGTILWWLGELVPARRHLEQGVGLHDPEKHHSHAFLYGRSDPGEACLSYGTWTLWALGYPEQALKKSHEALTLAQELSHPFSLTHALDWAAALHQFRREGQAVQELSEAAITLSTDQGFVLWSALGTILRGWALAEQGQGEEGIAQIRQGLAAYRAAGAELGQPHFLALLAEAHGKVGQIEEGLAVLAEALALVHKNEERCYEAELYRLKGELLKQRAKGKSGSPAAAYRPGQKARIDAEAEECFHQAIGIARRQSAKSWELRAAISLSRLWQNQSKREEARQMLAEIYGWFTEGFDTVDLKEAKALLEKM